MWLGLWTQICLVGGVLNEVRVLNCESPSGGRSSLDDSCTSISSGLEKIECLQNTLPEGASCELSLIESWNITHYCIATDSDIGGWAFRIPISLPIHPQNIKNASFSATLVPTTGDNDIIQTHSVQANLFFLPDTFPMDLNHSLVRQCKLKTQKYGTSGLIKVLRTETSPDHIPATADYPDDHIPATADHSIYKPIIFTIDKYINNGQDDKILLKPENAVAEIITNAQIISNNGVLAPALNYPRFTVTYSANVSGKLLTETAD